MPLTYRKGSSLPQVAVTWEDHDGTVLDFSAGWTFSADVGHEGQPAIFTKTTGFIGSAAAPNLTIVWPSTGELNDLEADRNYAIVVTAVRNADGARREMPLSILVEDPFGTIIGPRVGPCETWPYLPCDTGCDGPEEEALIASAATHVLWALSGKRYGYCDMDLRPCARRCDWQPTVWSVPWAFSAAWTPGWGSWPSCGCGPGRRGGSWYNGGSGGSSQPCSCADLPTLRLPGPIASLTQVRVDGVDLNLVTDVRVDQWRYLTRTDGGTWPACQDFTVTDGPGTLLTRYRRGRRVPPLAQLAMGELVFELARSCKGQPCGLSGRVKEVTRKGVTEVTLDPQMFLDKGRTGLPKCDLFLTTVNPHGMRRPSRVYRADSTV